MSGVGSRPPGRSSAAHVSRVDAGSRRRVVNTAECFVMVLRALPAHSVASSPADLLAVEAERTRAIQAGDERAFESLFREHFEGLTRYVERMVRSEAIAQEIVQGVLLRIWEKRAELEVTTTLASYLYRSVRNGALMHLRRARLEQEHWSRARAERVPLLGQSRVPQADERVRVAELQAVIDETIERLPPRRREAILLRREQHLTYPEIAEAMGISVKTVEVQIGAALRALRQRLSDWRQA